LKENKSIAKGEIQTISNYSDKKRSVCEINLLKEEIFNFIKEKLINNKETTKIFKLFIENKIYIDLNQILRKMELKLL
jgi:hypothetical protein